MARRHGITQNTYKRLLIDSGEVRKNFTSVQAPGTLLGATKGGSSVTITTEYKKIDVDGAKGAVKGGRRITNVEVKATINFAEWTEELIKLSLPASEVAQTPGISTITRDSDIADTDYLNNIAILGQISGYNNPGIVVVKNVICTSPFEISLIDGEEAVLKMEFEGHYTTSDLETDPFEIIWVNDVT